MKLDLKQFKKVTEDGDRATLKHPDGHEIHISKASLSPEQLSGLQALPFHGPKSAPKKNFADGGIAEQAINDFVDQDQGASMPQGTPNPPNVNFINSAADQQQASAQDAVGPAPASAAPMAAAPDAAALSDPYGFDAENSALLGGINQQRAGIAAQAKAEGELGAAQGKTYDEKAAQEKDLLSNFQMHHDELMQERGQFMQDYMKGEIDPDHYLHNKSTLGTISTGIGLLLGGLGSGMSGQNQALNFLNQNIDRDIAAQRDNLGKKKSLLEANAQSLGDLRLGTDMTRVMMSDMAAANISAAAAKSADPLAKARAQQAIGQLQQQSAPIIQQMAVRKAALNGLKNGTIDPSTAIRFLVPDKEQEAAHKDLDTQVKLDAVKQQALASFDRLSNMVAAGKLNPSLRKSEIAKVSGALVKLPGARFNEDNARALVEGLMPGGADKLLGNMAEKRRNLVQNIGQTEGSSLLRSYGIQARPQGPYDANGLPPEAQKALQIIKANPNDPRAKAGLMILKQKYGI